MTARPSIFTVRLIETVTRHIEVEAGDEAEALQKAIAAKADENKGFVIEQPHISARVVHEARGGMKQSSSRNWGDGVVTREGWFYEVEIGPRGHREVVSFEASHVDPCFYGVERADAFRNLVGATVPVHNWTRKRGFAGTGVGMSTHGPVRETDMSARQDGLRIFRAEQEKAAAGADRLDEILRGAS